MKKKTCTICHSTIQDYQHTCIQCGAKIKRSIIFRFSQYHPIKQILLLNIPLLFYLYIRNYRFPFHFILILVLFSTFAIIVFSLFKIYVSSKFKYKTPIYYFSMLFFYTFFIIISFDLTPKNTARRKSL